MIHYLLNLIFCKLTRVCVVDERVNVDATNVAGRVSDKYNVSVVHSLQDNGRTLKLYLTDKKGL